MVGIRAMPPGDLIRSISKVASVQAKEVLTHTRYSSRLGGIILAWFGIERDMCATGTKKNASPGVNSGDKSQLKQLPSSIALTPSFGWVVADVAQYPRSQSVTEA